MEELARRKPEDSVEYRLIFKVSESVSVEEQKQSLRSLADQCLAHHSSALVGHIWQNEPLKLTAVPSGGGTPAHLFGRTNFGDFIEDEWFIVWLLLELTKAHDDLIVQVCDNDGEFLLIEAADHLPRWLKPETAENRVFLYRGSVHIVPMPTSPGDLRDFPTGTPSLSQSSECVRKFPDRTQCSPQIQRAIIHRLSGFPERARENIHRAHCYVPAAIASLLDNRPQLVSAAVDAFCSRNPADLKVCRTFQHFRPGTRVQWGVKFTRCQYAQLMHDQFTPDRRSGYGLPPPSSPTYKAHDLGSKLAHGFEMLCADVDLGSLANNNLQAPSVSSPRWLHFVSSLSEKGYFRGELEGSVEYQGLQSEAHKFFLQSVQTSNDDRETLGGEILQLVSSLVYDQEVMKKAQLPPEDDDSWLELSEADLQQLMARMAETSPGNSATPSSSNSGYDLSHMVDSVSQFVEGDASLDGAEFPGQGDGDIQFDPSSMIASMQKIFDFKDDPGSNSSSDMSEYSDDGADDLSRHDAGTRGNKTFAGGEPGLSELMEMMDKELSTTEVGKSFQREQRTPQRRPPPTTSKSAPPKAPPRRPKKPPPPQPGPATSSSSPPAASSSTRPAPPPRPKPPARPPAPHSAGGSKPSRPAPPQPPKKRRPKSGVPAPIASPDDDDFDLGDDEGVDSDDEEEYRPVDVDVNLLKNMLESYSAQGGGAGPAGNILHGLGFALPPDEAKSKGK